MGNASCTGSSDCVGYARNRAQGSAIIFLTSDALKYFVCSVVRRLASAPRVASPKPERLRVQIKRLGGKARSFGYCDVLVNVADRCPPDASVELRRSATTTVFHEVQNVPADRSTTEATHQGTSGIPLWSVIVIASVCILCLSAPHYDQSSSSSVSSQLWPKWLCISFSQKLVASYVLGIVTAVFLKS
ncbi:unnamed protein product [Soboliphyme baturini]|uniref:Uncharacterized protein n=1 Tax=Soboliphyme baturini TaxID=241478 RepID=A0A183IZK1_9BILA|nr:unnamed protein product [Soboliphyme baturini]